MNPSENGVKSGLWLDREVVGHRVLNGIPINAENAIVIREHIARDVIDITDDVTAEVSRSLKVDSETLLASLDQSCDLWHVCVVQDVKSLRHDPGMSALGERSRVRVADE